MICLHYSNRIEALIPALASSIARSQAEAPLRRVPIIVPGRVIQEFVTFRVAEEIGIAANLEFPFLRGFLRALAERADPSLAILESEQLQLAIFEAIRAPRHLDPSLAPIHDYLGDSHADDAQELRTWLLAGRLARLFHEYSIARADMVWRWPTGVGESVASATANWQRALWQKLFDPRGCLRPEFLASDDRRWMLLPDGFGQLSSKALRSALPPRVHIFGLAYAGPAYARIFSQIGSLCELHIHALNPCMEFWEDLDDSLASERLARRERWPRRGYRMGKRRGRRDSFAGDIAGEDPFAPEQFTLDLFAIDSPGDQPALRLWSRPGREYIRLLNELTECDFEPHFVHPVSDPAGGSALLAHLQENILVRAPEPDAGANLSADPSIRFLACPTIRREAEIIANEIWSQILRAGSSPLRFHQIAVLVPDQVYDSYLPHLEAAFAELHQIPVNVFNRRFATQSRVADAVSLLLQLPKERFTRHQILHLLTHPALNADRDRDTSRWDRWCDALGVYFGADQRDLANTYIPRGLVHWDQMLKRLALGAFLDSGDEDSPGPFAVPGDDAAYLPYQSAQEELDALADFVRATRGLIADAAELRACRATIDEWARLLTEYIVSYIAAPEAADERVRDRYVAAIGSIAENYIGGDPVGYDIACELALAHIASVEASYGGYSESGVAIGPLSALRAIPFRVVFLAGMNEQFPEAARNDAIDLRSLRRRTGDVTSIERDRYLFLETLLAAREEIIMSYVARDPNTGDAREPSSIIRELQFILRSYLAPGQLAALTTEHPVSRYDPRYFPDLDPSLAADPHLISFDPGARRGACVSILRQDLVRHCAGVPLPPRNYRMLDRLGPQLRDMLRAPLVLIDPPDSANASENAGTDLYLPLSALCRYLECPLQGSARYALKMLDDADPESGNCEDEPLAQSRLDRTLMLRELFQAGQSDPAGAAEAYAKIAAVQSAAGRAAMGPFGDAARVADLKWVKGWLDQTRSSGAEQLADWQRVLLARGGEISDKIRIVNEIQLPIPESSTGRSITAHIFGDAGLFSGGLEMAVMCVMRKKPKPNDFARMFLGAIALAAAGEQQNQWFKAVVLGDPSKSKAHWTRLLAVPTVQAARDYLALLVSDLLFGRNHIFLPIEAVAQIATKPNLTDAEVEDAIDSIRDNDFDACSSDFGPIRDGRQFDSPAADEARVIIARRFALMGGIFEPVQ